MQHPGGRLGGDLHSASLKSASRGALAGVLPPCPAALGRAPLAASPHEVQAPPCAPARATTPARLAACVCRARTHAACAWAARRAGRSLPLPCVWCWPPARQQQRAQQASPCARSLQLDADCVCHWAAPHRRARRRRCRPAPLRTVSPPSPLPPHPVLLAPRRARRIPLPLPRASRRSCWRPHPSLLPPRPISWARTPARQAAPSRTPPAVVRLALPAGHAAARCRSRAAPCPPLRTPAWRAAPPTARRGAHCAVPAPSATRAASGTAARRRAPCRAPRASPSRLPASPPPAAPRTRTPTRARSTAGPRRRAAARGVRAPSTPASHTRCARARRRRPPAAHGPARAAASWRAATRRRRTRCPHGARRRHARRRAPATTASSAATRRRAAAAAPIRCPARRCTAAWAPRPVPRARSAVRTRTPISRPAARGRRSRRARARALGATSPIRALRQA
jgi:hypothetical protein